MANDKTATSPIPTTGELLDFIVDCLGVPKNTDAYSHKDLERLRNGGMAPGKHWEVARRVTKAIVASFVDEGTASNTMDQALAQKTQVPLIGYRCVLRNGLWNAIPEYLPQPQIRARANEALRSGIGRPASSSRQAR